MGGQSEGSGDSAVAMRAASRVASERARGARAGVAKKRSGSLVLTALAVLAVLVGMLVLMVKLGG